MTTPNARQLAIVFAARLRLELGAETFTEMQARNALEAYQHDACASHDFCDANMVMAAAWRGLTGAEFDPESSAQTALFNSAWDIAKAEFLTGTVPAAPPATETLTLDLTAAERRALREIGEMYLSRGAPAWECAQMWDPPHEPADVESLGAKIAAATA